jgi:hypothetical protein
MRNKQPFHAIKQAYNNKVITYETMTGNFYVANLTNNLKLHSWDGTVRIKPNMVEMDLREIHQHKVIITQMEMSKNAILGTQHTSLTNTNLPILWYLKIKGCDNQVIVLTWLSK